MLFTKVLPQLVRSVPLYAFTIQASVNSWLLMHLGNMTPKVCMPTKGGCQFAFARYASFFGASDASEALRFCFKFLFYFGSRADWHQIASAFSFFDSERGMRVCPIGGRVDLRYVSKVRDLVFKDDYTYSRWFGESKESNESHELLPKLIDGSSSSGAFWRPAMGWNMGSKVKVGV